MDGDSWSARLSSASKRYQSALQSRSDMFMGFEEIDGDDDIREEFPCPFCSEYFDIVGLCCHIDEEHPVEAKNGFCNADMFMGFEEIDGDDDIREEFPCPFCSEYFDIVGLCCHIDEEHPVEAKNGVCPVCAMRVGVDMVAHITLQHGNIFKISFSFELLSITSSLQSFHALFSSHFFLVEF
nr:protein dehydration-induced 19 like 3 [Quercus suber]